MGQGVGRGHHLLTIPQDVQLYGAFSVDDTAV